MGGAAGAHNHDAAWCWKCTVLKEGIVMVLSLSWLQLDDGLATLVPRQAIRKASMENGLSFFIMKKTARPSLWARMERDLALPRFFGASPPVST